MFNKSPYEFDLPPRRLSPIGQQHQDYDVPVDDLPAVLGNLNDREDRLQQRDENDACDSADITTLPFHREIDVPPNTTAAIEGKR